MAILIRKKYYYIDISHYKEEWNCSEEEVKDRFNSFSDEELEDFMEECHHKWIYTKGEVDDK